MPALSKQELESILDPMILLEFGHSYSFLSAVSSDMLWVKPVECKKDETVTVISLNGTVLVESVEC